MITARDALRALKQATLTGEDPEGVRWYAIADTPLETAKEYLEHQLKQERPMPSPKPITAARKLLRTLYNESRPPTQKEYFAIDLALYRADARTRLDPTKRKRATVKR